MLKVLLVALFILWFLGYIHIPALPIPNVALLAINGRTVTLWDVLTFLVILILLGVLPRPFREIGAVLLILWLLALFGILAISGLSSLIVLAIIIGGVAYLLGGA